MTALDKITER